MNLIDLAIVYNNFQALLLYTNETDPLNDEATVVKKIPSLTLAILNCIYNQDPQKQETAKSDTSIWQKRTKLIGKYADKRCRYFLCNLLAASRSKIV